MEEDHPHPAPSDPEPDAPPPTEAQLQGRLEMARHLRTLVRFVCEQRLGAVPPEVAALLPDEHRVANLSRWYIAAGTLSAEELTAFVRAPLPE